MVKYLEWSFDCPLCGKTLETLTIPFCNGEFDDAHEKKHAQEHIKNHLIVDHWDDLFGFKHPSEIDKNILDQKAEELLMNPEWEYFVGTGKWISKF